MTDWSSLQPRLLQKLDIDYWKRSALRTLTNGHSTRINQSEITAQLEGLEEKWMISNKNSLADALHIQRAEFSLASNRWTPEILSFLLELSDRPLQYSNLTHLALPKPELPAALTWAEIVAEASPAGWSRRCVGECGLCSRWIQWWWTGWIRSLWSSSTHPEIKCSWTSCRSVRLDTSWARCQYIASGNPERAVLESDRRRQVWLNMPGGWGP